MVVLVAYHPNAKTLLKAVNSLTNQVSKIIIVDNSDNAENSIQAIKNGFENFKNIEFINLEKNYGIARAQNIGIQSAIALNAEFVLLSDQDSEYPIDFVSKMLFNFQNLTSAKTEKIAAIAPNFEEINRAGEKQGFTIFDVFLEKKIKPISGCHKVTQVIASGTIIPVDSFTKIGMMNESLFIDWVDFEWCWRANKIGHSIIGCADVVIKHAMGDTVHAVLKKSYSIRSPIRHYYVIRNGIYLALYCSFISFSMRVHIIRKSLRYFIGFTVLGKPHLKHFKYCMLGIFDGMRGKLGECRYR